MVLGLKREIMHIGMINYRNWSCKLTEIMIFPVLDSIVFRIHFRRQILSSVYISGYISRHPKTFIMVFRVLRRLFPWHFVGSDDFSGWHWTPVTSDGPTTFFTLWTHECQPTTRETNRISSEDISASSDDFLGWATIPQVPTVLVLYWSIFLA